MLFFSTCFCTVSITVLTKKVVFTKKSVRLRPLFSKDSTSKLTACFLALHGLEAYFPSEPTQQTCFGMRMPGYEHFSSFSRMTSHKEENTSFIFQITWQAADWKSALGLQHTTHRV